MLPRVEPFSDVSWDRITKVHEDIANRQIRITTALKSAGVPYAVVGGQAVAAWVATIDPAAVRSTKDVDILLDRSDLPRAKQAANPAGFEYFEVMGVGMFLERLSPNPKHAVHIVWTNQFVKPDDVLPTPAITDRVELADGTSIVSLEWLVRMKLTASRLHDKVHIRDMIDVGLIDASWLAKLPPELATRLQHLLDTPDG
jgi:hypothetical protein